MAHSICRQDVDASVTVQGVIGYMKIKTDLIQDLLPHIYNMLEQLGSQGGGHSASPHTEAMQGVVKIDFCCEVEIQYLCHGLT